MNTTFHILVDRVLAILCFVDLIPLLVYVKAIFHISTFIKKLVTGFYIMNHNNTMNSTVKRLKRSSNMPQMFMWIMNSTHLPQVGR